MPFVQPTTTGTAAVIDNLDSVVLSNGTISWFPTIDSDGNMQHNVPTTKCDIIDNTSGGLYSDFSFVIATYVVDIWSYIASRMAPGSKGAAGTISGVGNSNSNTLA